jgi:hypothetical protein
MGKVPLLCELGYVIFCVGNLTEERSPISMFEFHTGVWIPEICWKNLVILVNDVTEYVNDDEALSFQ